MTIQINTDKTVKSDERQQAYFKKHIEESLSRFGAHITRIEVHFKDENGEKDGVNDITCLLEARLEGRQPIAVTNQANSVEQALNGSLDKAKSAIDRILGKLKNK